MKFITLTTAAGGSYEELKADSNTLVKRIRRKYGRFEYFRVKTREGHGVLHILAVCQSYIPYPWLREAWRDIHGAWVVDIQELKNTGQKLAKYVISQYCSEQDYYDGYSWSKFWVFPGFVKVWHYFLSKMHYKAALKAWKLFLRQGFIWLDGFTYPPPESSLLGHLENCRRAKVYGHSKQWLRSHGKGKGVQAALV